MAAVGVVADAGCAEPDERVRRLDDVAVVGGYESAVRVLDLVA